MHTKLGLASNLTRLKAKQPQTPFLLYTNAVFILLTVPRLREDNYYVLSLER